MMLSELHDLEGERPHWIIPRAHKNKKAEQPSAIARAVRLISKRSKSAKNIRKARTISAVFASASKRRYHRPAFTESSVRAL